jgi:sec-independent protein translocase protein TatA
LRVLQPGYTRQVIPNVGIEEMLLLLVLALLLFGPKKLPEMARQLGKGVRDFKDAIAGLDEPAAPLPMHVEMPPDPPDADETL